MSAGERGKLKAAAEADPALTPEKRKRVALLKGDGKQVHGQGSRCTQEASFSPSFVLSVTPKPEENVPAFTGDVARKLGEMWNSTCRWEG